MRVETGHYWVGRGGVHSKKWAQVVEVKYDDIAGQSGPNYLAEMRWDQAAISPASQPNHAASIHGIIRSTYMCHSGPRD